MRVLVAPVMVAVAAMAPVFAAKVEVVDWEVVLMVVVQWVAMD